MIKKFLKPIAVTTAALMIAAISLTGCSGSKSSGTTATATPGQSSGKLDPVTLKWVIRIPTQKGSDAVVAQVNKTLQEKINATLNVQWIDAASYAEKTKLMIASSEDFDVMWTSSGFGFYDNVAKGAYAPMDDLLQKYASKSYSQIPKGFWDATKVNNKIYGFPNYQIAGRQTVLTVRKDIAAKYNIDMTKVKTLEDFTPILEKIKAGEGTDNYITLPPNLSGIDAMTYLGLESIGAQDSPGAVEIDGKDYKVVNQFEYPSFVKTMKLIKDWADKGFIKKDLALAKDWTELYKAGKVFTDAGMSTYLPGFEAQSIARYNYDPVIAYVTPQPYLSTSAVVGTIQTISRTSKNPERAMMMLDIVNTDKAVYNTLVYGLENTNYKKTGDNTIELIPDSGYATNVAWMIGNTLNGYLLPGVAADAPAQTDKINKEAKVSRVIGFTFDPTPVKSEIAQCATITKKYLDPLRMGLVDVDSNITAMNKELRAAGLDKIIAEKQKQLDAWAAANKK